MSRDLKDLILHTKSFKEDWAQMKARIAQHVLEGGPDPYVGWAQWPKWALSFKERLLLKHEREQAHAALRTARLAGEPVPAKWLRNQKRKERKKRAADRASH